MTIIIREKDKYTLNLAITESLRIFIRPEFIIGQKKEDGYR